jgi:hypothetical protein
MSPSALEARWAPNDLPTCHYPPDGTGTTTEEALLAAVAQALQVAQAAAERKALRLHLSRAIAICNDRGYRYSYENHLQESRMPPQGKTLHPTTRRRPVLLCTLSRRRPSRATYAATGHGLVRQDTDDAGGKEDAGRAIERARSF